MPSKQQELRDALNELRFNFHHALAARFGGGITDDGKLRRLIEYERNEKRVRALMGQRRRRFVGVLAIFLLSGLLLTVGVFRSLGPFITPVAIAEKLTGRTFTRNWVPLANVSPELPLAVVASEDAHFCDHWGVDWKEAWAAVKGGGRPRSGLRGASTIPMQTVKNLYLWPQRSYFRKTLEVPLAYLLSTLWGKKVVIETYLNIAPWGPGIVGAEAASRHYFHKSAGKLTREEASLLAAALPYPSVRNPAKPSPGMLRKARLINKDIPIVALNSECVLTK